MYSFKEPNQIENYLDPLVFTLTFNNAQTHLDRTNIFQEPIVEGVIKQLTTEAYIKMCSNIARKCVSNIMLNLNVLLNDDEEIEITDRVIELIEGLHHKVKLQIMVLNHGEPAFNGKLNITLNSTLSLVNIDRRCQLLMINNENYTSNSNSNSRIECTLINPLDDNNYIDSMVEIVFNPFDKYIPVNFSININIDNNLHPDSLTQENVIFKKVKRAAIDLKVYVNIYYCYRKCNIFF